MSSFSLLGDDGGNALFLSSSSSSSTEMNRDFVSVVVEGDGEHSADGEFGELGTFLEGTAPPDLVDLCLIFSSFGENTVSPVDDLRECLGLILVSIRRCDWVEARCILEGLVILVLDLRGLCTVIEDGWDTLILFVVLDFRGVF